MSSQSSISRSSSADSSAQQTAGTKLPIPDPIILYDHSIKEMGQVFHHEKKSCPDFYTFTSQTGETLVALRSLVQSKSPKGYYRSLRWLPTRPVQISDPYDGWKTLRTDRLNKGYKDSGKEFISVDPTEKQLLNLMPKGAKGFESVETEYKGSESDPILIGVQLYPPFHSEWPVDDDDRVGNGYRTAMALSVFRVNASSEITSDRGNED